MYTEDQLVMISALQHFVFCKRQCALIHVEQQWADNGATTQGELLHEKVHTETHETRGNMRTVRSLRLVSYRLGLVGQSDVVEFQRTESDENTVELQRCAGYWTPFPVEYKKGKPKKNDSDKVQLCAQAICLEEQLGISIAEGAIYYGTNRRRLDVQFEAALRQQTEDISLQLHHLIESGKTPAPIYEKKCSSCSLGDICRPRWSTICSAKHYETLMFERNGDP